MTTQEIFEKALRGVIAQGALAQTQTGSCAYRFADGRKCAAGHILTEEQLDRIYAVGLNERGFAAVNDFLELFDESNSQEFALIEAMQRAHDTANNLEAFKAGMKRVASNFDLSYPKECE